MQILHANDIFGLLAGSALPLMPTLVLIISAAEILKLAGNEWWRKRKKRDRRVKGGNSAWQCGQENVEFSWCYAAAVEAQCLMAICKLGYFYCKVSEKTLMGDFLLNGCKQLISCQK